MEMCENSIYSALQWKVIQLKRAFLWESLEPNLRPCSQNKNNINEIKISCLPIAKTISVDLETHQGEPPNTKQTETMV